MEIEYISPGLLKPYEKNAKMHPPDQVEHIANSIKEFGFRQPIVIDADNVIVIGHGRLLAAKRLGLETVPCVRADDLNDAQIKALRLADNKTNESDWDLTFLVDELEELKLDFDMDEFGFGEKQADWFDRKEKDGDKRQEGNEEYNDFLDKFEPKKTTDDCYTPDNVYDAVAGWVENEYGVNRKTFIRPFYPGGDYKNEKYSNGCVVVDNPPFSILAEIIRYYCASGIRFFLFAPSLTLFTAVGEDVTYLPSGVDILYENGATVTTSFITNLDDCRIFVSPELYAAVNAANKENEKAAHKELPKFNYPDEVILAARIYPLAKYGQTLRIPKAECVYQNRLDSQKEARADAFGGLFLISERAAAERAAAERAAAERAAAERAAAERAAAERAAAKKWELSEREKEIIRNLGE